MLVFVLGTIPIYAQDKEDVGYQLLYAADAGEIEQVRVALLKGAPVDFTTPEGVTALMYASAAGYVDVANLLIEMGADVNAKPFNSRRSALVAAVENGQVEVAELLIRNGAELTYIDNSGASLLHIAAGSMVWEMTDLLLYYEFPAEIIDVWKRTPLHYASFYGFDANVRVLLANGANVNSVDDEGNAAIHYAVSNNYLKVLKELVKHGGKVNVKNNKGFSPLDLAALNGNDSIVRYLLEQKAEINDSISAGVSTLLLARESGNRALVKSLKEKGAKFNYKPYFNAVDFGFFVNTNFDDTYMGAVLGVHENKYNIDIDVKFGKRTSKYQVLYKKEPNYYEYYWEKRRFAALGITKHFDVLRTLSGWRFGIDAGIFQAVSWSKNIGMSATPPLNYPQAYRVGLSVKYEKLRLGIHYDYMKFPLYDYSPSRLNFELKYYLYFKNDFENHLSL